MSLPSLDTRHQSIQTGAKDCASLAILVSSREELGALNDLSVGAPILLPGLEASEMAVEDRRVLVGRSAGGKINGALAASALIYQLHASYLLLVGTCGAIDPELEIGDIVLGSRAFIHDYGVRQNGTFRHRGSVPLLIRGREERRFEFTGDIEGQQRAMNILVGAGFRVTGGLLASGDVFIADPAERQRLCTQYGAVAAEMSVGGAAHVCEIARTPWLALRCASDRADHEAWDSYDVHGHIASARAVSAALALIRTGWPLP